LRRRGKASFDPKKFLAKVGEGKTISQYEKGRVVFSQGDVANAVFYIQKGEIKLTVTSEQGKEAVVGILGPALFLAKAVSTAIRCASRPLRRWLNAWLRVSPRRR
jgi:CRP/FNR family transcriptional regulator, cyclic AMP receptor protein